MLRDSRLEYMNRICTSKESNTKRFWSYFKLKSKASNIPDKVSIKINEIERIIVDGNTDIANAFNKYFASIFTKDEDGSFEQDDLSQDDVRIIDDVILSEEESTTEGDGYADYAVTSSSFQQVLKCWCIT